MADRTELRARLEFRREALKAAREAYLKLLGGGVKSYTIGERTLTRLDLPELKRDIVALEQEVDGLEAMLSGGSARRAVGVVPRDI